MLSRLGFMDLYLNLDNDHPARIRPFVRDKITPPTVILPEKYVEEANELSKLVKEKNRDDFSLNFDGMRLRVSRKKTSAGSTWAAIRKIPDQIPTMEDLRVPEAIAKKLKFLGRNSGLIVFCGATGQGKSTSAISLLGSYLSEYGDVCITIEDPTEYDLQSKNWGPNAACFQFEVEEEQDWANYVKMALRWHPRYILLGELRTAEATAQALRAATSGHLVISTLHAGSLEEAIHAIRHLASPVTGSRTDSLVADSFLGVVHQRLIPSGPIMKTLFAHGKGLGDPVRAGIRSGKIETLASIIEQQNRAGSE